MIQHHRDRRGSLAVIVAISLVAILAGGAVVVDLGWARASGNQLQANLDSASLSAALLVDDGPLAARAQAQGMAARHQAGGKDVTLADTDIEFGDWDDETKTFTPNADDTGWSVRVTHTLGGVSAFLGPLMDRDSYDLTRVSISGPRTGGAKCGIIAKTLADVTGSVIVDSYDSTVGGYADSQAENGGVCANANVECGGSAEIYGSLYIGPSGDLSSTCTITGTEGTLRRDLEVPDVDCAAAAASNDNASVAAYINGSGAFRTKAHDTLTLSGTYYFEGMDIHGQSNITINGDVTICNEGGAVKLNGGAILNSSGDPTSFVLEVADNSALTLNGNSAFYGALIAPYSSDVRLNGNMDFYGLVVGETINVSGNLDFHADEALMDDWMEANSEVPSILR